MLPATVNILTAAGTSAHHGSGHDLPWPYERRTRLPAAERENASHTYSFSSSDRIEMIQFSIRQ
jgi:hypothetical protein